MIVVRLHLLTVFYIFIAIFSADLSSIFLFCSFSHFYLVDHRTISIAFIASLIFRPIQSVSFLLPTPANHDQKILKYWHSLYYIWYFCLLVLMTLIFTRLWTYLKLESYFQDAIYILRCYQLESKEIQYFVYKHSSELMIEL